MACRRDEAERVAVGGRPRQLEGADVAAGAALVVGHKRLAEALRELVADHATHDIVATAGRGGNDETHRPGRPRSLGARAGRANEQWPGERCCKQTTSQHEAFLPSRGITRSTQANACHAREPPSDSTYAGIGRSRTCCAVNV